jgi:SNF family Na+-dependent transporter
VLQLTSGLEELGSVRWELLGLLVVAWILVYFCLWKSVRATGKVVYVTATLPYILLFVFMGRALMLDGASDGLKYFFTPKWESLAEAKVTH